MKKEIRVKCHSWYPSVSGEKFLSEVLFGRLLHKNFIVEHDEKNPDFVFVFNVNNNTLDNYDPRKVYIGITGECVSINFNTYDYGIGFDPLSIGDRYLQFSHPFWMGFFGWEDCDPNRFIPDFPLIDENKATKLLLDKDKFCTFVVSNQKFAHKNRIDMFHKLSQYKEVSSGGKVLNNIGGSLSNKTEFQSQGKFAITFENTSHLGYRTEKIVDALRVNTIPIYWGDPHITEYVNPEAFINCHEYNSLDEVVERVKEIDANDELWKKMIMTPNKIDVNKINTRIQQLEDFLYTICSQPPQKAKRIPEIRSVHTTKNKKLFYISQQLISIFYRRKINQKQLEKNVELQKQEISIHVLPNKQISHCPVFQVLNSNYNLVEKTNALIHLYFDYPDNMKPHGSYQNSVNIHIASSQDTYHEIPDFNIYDYMIGYHDIQFGDRYLNLTQKNTEKDILDFFANIFESPNPFRRTKEYVLTYFESVKKRQWNSADPNNK